MAITLADIKRMAYETGREGLVSWAEFSGDLESHGVLPDEVAIARISFREGRTKYKAERAKLQRGKR